MSHAWGEIKCIYSMVVGKSEGKRPLRRPSNWWEDNIKIDLDIEWDGVDWVRAQDTEKRWAVVKMIMNLQDP